MWPTSQRFQNTVRVSHKIAVEADVYSRHTEGWQPLEVTGGEVTLNSSLVRAMLRMTVVDTENISRALDITSGFIRVRRGVEFMDGTRELVPLGVFRLYSRGPAQVNQRGHRYIVLSGVDYMRAVQEARYAMPRTYESNSAIQLMWSSIVDALAGTIPTALKMKSTVADKRFASMFIDRERLDLISRAEVLLGSDIYFDGNGQLIVREAKSLDDAPVQWISSDSGLLQASESFSRDKMFNAVVVFGERTDGGEPVSAVVYDQNFDSPLYWNGPFGRVPKFYSSPILTTQDMCVKAGKTILKKRSGITRTLGLEAMPNPAFEPGDVLKVYTPEGVRYVILDEFQIPLGPSVALAARVRVTDEAAAATSTRMGGTWGWSDAA